MTHQVHPDIPVSEADSVTHFICPQGPASGGVPVATHHLVPRRAGLVGGQPAFEEVCTYCGQSAHALRVAIGLNGGR